MRHLITITDKDFTGSVELSSVAPRIAVNAILFDDKDNIAICYMGKYDLHTLPGGGVELGENLHSALNREVYEETGCKCEIIGELGVIIENCLQHDFTQERYYYIARVIGEKGDLHLTEEEIAEDTKVVWLTLEETLKFISEKQQDNYQRKFIQKRDVVALREFAIWLNLHDIPQYDLFAKIEPVNKGWSSDKKYYAETTDNKRFLIRTAEIGQYEQKKAEFENMRRVAALGVPMQHPVDFGLCNDGKYVFLILTWIDGNDAEEILPLLTETEQYLIGLKAGKILKEMQTIDNIQPSDDWFNNYGIKINNYIKNYRNCGLTFEGDERLITYIEQNRHITKNRPMCLTHDDYHPGNLILNKKGELFVIDFQRLRMVEPYHALAGVQFSANNCSHFAKGQLNAYFEGEPPKDFWQILKLYMVCVAVNALPWSIPFGQNEIEFAYKQIADIISWYNNMQNVIPTWYLSSYELWDIYDENRNKTGRLHERGNPMATGDYHLIVHVWKYNNKGEWLIDKRTPRYGDSYFDGKWETTGGCAVMGDDSLSAALRETREELGIELDLKCGSLFSSKAQKWEDGHTAFVDVWVFEYNEPIESLTFDEREVNEVMWAKVDKIKEMMAAGMFLDYPYFEDMVERYGV